MRHRIMVLTTMLALALSPTLVACSAGVATPVEITPSPSNGAQVMTVSPSVDPVDVMFVQMMIPHHQQAIAMAQMALDEPTSSTKVKELATQIKDAQDPEIQLMDTWLNGWKESDLAPTSHGMDMSSGMMTDAEMTELMKQQGVAFDQMWTEMMIAHHQGAVAMANDVLANSTNTDVRALAQAVISVQEKEIAMMKGWLTPSS